MKSISVEEVVVFQRKIINKTDGSTGIRDLGLVESALNKAFLTFDGQDLYKGHEEKISVIIYAMVKNHGFVDGNKRIGIAVMLLLLRLNQINNEFTQDDLVHLGLGVSDGSLLEIDIQKWIREHKK